MNNIDRYDDQAMQQNVDLAELARKKEKSEKRKRKLLFSAKLFGYHIIAYILYVFIFSTTSDAEVAHETGLEQNILAFFCTLSILLFSFVISFELSWDGDACRSYKNILKSEPYRIKLPFRLSLDFILPYSIIYFVMQIPGILFHHFFGYSYTNPIIIDAFYTMDIGFMELTGISLLGAVINTILFAVFLIGIRFFIYYGWKREKERFEKGEKVRRRYG